METVKIRIGNDIPCVWKFYTKIGDTKVPYIIEGKDVRIVMTDIFGTKTEFNVTVSGNSASWTFYGKDQTKTGAYTFTFYENFGSIGMKALDKIQPFRLVSEQEVVESGTIDGCCSSMEVSPFLLESEISDNASHPYLSLERIRPYLYRVTFDSLPEDNGGDKPVIGGCSSYVANGKLYRNLDWGYDNTASFIVRTKDFEGMSFITGLNDGALEGSLIAQLPYRVCDGVNNHGIKVSTHILFNDWQWTGSGERSVNITRLPFLVLSRVKSMATLAQDLNGVLDNLYAPEGLEALGYLIQLVVTDGQTTYAVLPPTSEGQSYVLQDITNNPKLTNFRWVASGQVERQDMDLQTRPTGIERFNMMPCDLSDLRFTKAYENPTRLSEFIGINETTKDSTDAELEAIYDLARAEYLTRERDGKTWQTMHSVVYGDRMEKLYIQEAWGDEILQIVNIVDNLKAIPGYDASATQVLKNVNGSISWVVEV